MSPPKMDKLVCAHSFFKRKGAKPILQATVPVTWASLKAQESRLRLRGPPRKQCGTR